MEGGSDGLVVSAPISSNAHVPLRRGTNVVVQAPTPDGLVTFASTVEDRLEDPPRVVLRGPERLRVVERRTERRWRATAAQHGSVDGESALVLDSSGHGACLLCRQRFEPGEVVVVGLPGLQRPVAGWVLDALPDAWDGREAYRTRVYWSEGLATLRP